MVARLAKLYIHIHRLKPFHALPHTILHFSALPCSIESKRPLDTMPMSYQERLAEAMKDMTVGVSGGLLCTA